MTTVALIIVHFNTPIETQECLASLQNISQEDITLHIFVIDNGSKIPLKLLDAQLPPQTRLIRSDANLGFTNGNNLGIDVALRETQPDYLVLLNSDTTVEPHFLEKLIAAAVAQPKLGMAVPKIYFSPGREFHTHSYSPDQRGKVLWFGGGSIDWANLDAFHRSVDEVDRGQVQHQAQTEFATGCCVLLPRAVVERVGKLDPKYFLYLEDVDWSLRIQQAGYELCLVPESVVWHKNAGSSGGSGSPLHRYYQTRNRLFFFMKYAPVHIFSSGGRSRIKNTLHLLWFYGRVWKLAGLNLINPDPMRRRAAFDWLFNRMGKQPVF